MSAQCTDCATHYASALHTDRVTHCMLAEYTDRNIACWHSTMTALHTACQHKHIDCVLQNMSAQHTDCITRCMSAQYTNHVIHCALVQHTDCYLHRIHSWRQLMWSYTWHTDITHKQITKRITSTRQTLTLGDRWPVDTGFLHCSGVTDQGPSVKLSWLNTCREQETEVAWMGLGAVCWWGVRVSPTLWQPKWRKPSEGNRNGTFCVVPWLVCLKCHMKDTEIILIKFMQALTVKLTFTPLERINDTNAISFYSVLRNATAHMHRKKKSFFFQYKYMYKYMRKYIYLECCALSELCYGCTFRIYAKL